ncbi:protein kinase domain-containing protein [Streptomyces sp. NPDC000880]
MSGDDTGSTDVEQSVGAGRYILRGLLGQGGMASVYLAHDTVLERLVAVKALHSDLSREPMFRERFRREARAVAKLNHVNIVSVHDSGEDTIDGAVVPYIVMEYVEGKPLRSVLKEDQARFGAMPAEKALKITSAVLAALAESHSMGLVHRDIKPSNIMLTNRGVVKVMDFGIARAVQSDATSVTRTGAVVGTPQYLAPEQALGQGADERSDLYSVGCTLFELLAGVPPFTADSALAVVYQHVQEIPPAPSEFNQAVPSALDSLVARSLSKDPAERFPTADAMREETERIAADEFGGVTTPLITGEAPGKRADGEEGDSAALVPVDNGAPDPPAPDNPSADHGRSAPPTGTRRYTMPLTPVARQSGGGLRRRALPIGSAAAAAAAIALLAVIAMNTASNANKAGADEAGRTGASTASASGPSAAAPPATGSGPAASKTATGPSPSTGQTDPGRTVRTSTCTNTTGANEDTDIFPDFTLKDINSVETCMKTAGWDYQILDRNEQLHSKGTVLSTNPASGSDFDPEGDKITVTVSTGGSG